jgi:hypothetical protein
MSKTKSAEPYVQQKVNIPATLMARFSLLHMDPVARKVKYGAVSKVVTRLLSEYVSRAEKDGVPEDA